MHVLIPNDVLRNRVELEMRTRLSDYSEPTALTVFVGTWNVNGGKLRRTPEVRRDVPWMVIPTS